MQILDRYCYVRFLVMLVVGTMLPAGVYFLTGQVQECTRFLVNFGCPIDMYARITMFQMPDSLVRSLPAGILIGTMLVLFRFMADSEILALQTCGVGLARVFRPFLMIGLCATLVSFLINEFVVPESLVLSTRMAMVAAAHSELPTGNGTNEYIGFEYEPDGRVKKLLLIAGRAGRQLTNAMLFDFTAGYVKLIWAPQGSYKGNNWHLSQGHIYELFKSSETSNNTRFEQMVLSPPNKLRFDPARRELLPFEMNSRQLAQKIESKRSAGLAVPADMLVQFQSKFADPCANIFLAVAAFPIALFGRRRQSSMLGFAYGGALVVFFFVFRQITTALATNGLLSPIIGAWAPGVVVATIGGVLLFLRTRR